MSNRLRTGLAPPTPDDFDQDFTWAEALYGPAPGRYLARPAVFNVYHGQLMPSPLHIPPSLQIPALGALPAVLPLPWPMRLALDAAGKAASKGEVPVGAVVTGPGGKVVAVAANRTRANHDPTAHAEILAIRAACAVLANDRLVGHTLWSTLEPCAMCAGALVHARIARLVFAAEDPKGGAIVHGPRVFSHPTCHHRPEILYGPGEDEAAAHLRAFFADLRA